MDQIIPLTTAPNQALTVSLTVDGNVLTLRLQLRYNEIAGYWVLTVSDRFGNILVDSVPMLLSLYPSANLLQQQRYLAVGSGYLVSASGNSDEYPDASNLGSDFQLVWGDTPAV